MDFRCQEWGASGELEWGGVAGVLLLAGDQTLRRWAVALAVLMLVGVGRIDAAVRTENFDVDPGWAVLGSGANGTQFGIKVPT